MYNPSVKSPQSLILTPTREIAIQIESVLTLIGKYTPNFKVGSFIGGLDITDDRKKINGCMCIVGTPGRIQHLLKSKILNISELKLVVLDEADQMISNFSTDVKNILSELKFRNQIIASSATFDPSKSLDKKLAEYMKNPIGVTPKKEAPILLGVKQFIVEIPQQDNSLKDMTRKIEEMIKIFTKIPFKQCLAFSNSQSRAESYCNYLNKDGWPSEVITGAQDQPTRIKVLNKLKDFKCRILLSTDLMARGIDADNVNLVINLDIPHDPSLYLHRIGRAGRFGSHGIAVTFVSSDKDLFNLRKVLGSIGGETMAVMRLPDDKNYDFWNFNDRETEKRICGEIFGLVDCKIESKEKIETVKDSKNGVTMIKEDNGIINKNLTLKEISKLLVDSEEEVLKSSDDLFEDFNQNKHAGYELKEPNICSEDDITVVSDNLSDDFNPCYIQSTPPSRKESDNSETVSVSYKTTDSIIKSIGSDVSSGLEEIDDFYKDFNQNKHSGYEFKDPEQAENYSQDEKKIKSKKDFKMDKKEEDIIYENLNLLQISKLLIDSEEDVPLSSDDLFEDFNQNKNLRKEPKQSGDSDTEHFSEDDVPVVSDNLFDDFDKSIVDNKMPANNKSPREESDNSETVSVTTDSSINSDTNGTNIGSDESSGLEESESEIDLFGKNIDNVENEIESSASEEELEPDEVESEDDEEDEVEDLRSPEGSMMNETGSYHNRYYSWTSQYTQQTTIIRDYVNFCKFVRNN